MRSKKLLLTNFSRALSSESLCIRPEKEGQLSDYIYNNKINNLLARGAGLSYSDSCLNKEGYIVDMNRLNHLISFDTNSGVVVCQGGALFRDLFLLHPDYIPPVLPGTMHATVAGGIAHDVHGKNNPHAGSFGHHIQWFELHLNGKTFRCSREEHADLFHATIAGLGLTGIITRIAIRLKKASRYVEADHIPMTSFSSLMKEMKDTGLHYDYQVAWLDLLNPGQHSLLSLAKYGAPVPLRKKETHSIAKLPFGLIKQWNMKLFNTLYYKIKKKKEHLALEEFNNPLDTIAQWNRLYGPKGFIQFQAVFHQDEAETLEQLIALIRHHKATPTLAVLKLFEQNGEGLLSFCKPGFTIAIDFINNTEAKQAVMAMNQLITEINGRIYLAKDILLLPEQYQKMYPNHQSFTQILRNYHSPMHSDLATRLEIAE